MFQPNILTFPEFLLTNDFREILLDSWNMSRSVKKSLNLTILADFGQMCDFDKIPMALVTDNSVFW